MPELPEVETVRRGLQAAVVGRTVTDVVATGARTLRRNQGSGDLVGAVAGRRLERARRWGKYLVLTFGGGRDVVVHLGMSGQLRYARPGEALAPHTHVGWSFAGGPQLRFVDPRTFGEVFVSAGPARAADGAGARAVGWPLELAHLGPDALGLDLPALRAVLAGRRTRLKPLLLDQRAVAGIGNIYADEILWTARLHPDRPAGGLSPAEVGRLAAAAASVLADAVARRGSSLADLQYRDLWGELGSYQEHHRAYGREGQPCGRCGRPIRRRRDGGRSTFHCPSCQRRRRTDAGPRAGRTARRAVP